MKNILSAISVAALLALPGSLANAQGDPFPYPAKSWGGIVRSGPGQQYQRVTSLREMEPIMMLERTNEMFNGYPWFRISYRGNRTGFHWGGIICPNHQSILGTFKVC